MCPKLIPDWLVSWTLCPKLILDWLVSLLVVTGASAIVAKHLDLQTVEGETTTTEDKMTEICIAQLEHRHCVKTHLTTVARLEKEKKKKKKSLTHV